MAHEIDFSKGYAAMFAVRVPVWHQQETGAKRLTFHPTSAEALIEAGLDYEVTKVPTKRVLPDGTLQDNDLAFSTVRMDTGAELGMVGRDYTPLQNRDALAVFDPLIASGHAVIETAGALRGGADIWVAIAWNLERFGELARKVFGEDPRGLLPYSVVRNNHNGRSNVVGMDVTICPVCANTLGMALTGAGVSESEDREGRITGNAFAVKHSANVKANVEAEAARMWSDRVALFELVAAQYETLKRATLDLGTFTRSGPETCEDARRTGTLYINRVPFHVEAYRVHRDNGEQVGEGEAEDWLAEWCGASGPDGPFQTVAWQGADWVLFLSPYC